MSMNAGFLGADGGGFLGIAHGVIPSPMSKPPKPEPPEIVDEPGMAERFQRGLQRALNTPAKHRIKPAPKPKERPTSNGRFQKTKLLT
jgi:hypothetical protein